MTVSACSLTRGAGLTDDAALKIAYKYLEEKHSITNAKRELSVHKIDTDELGLVHVNLKHVIDNVPVWGEDYKVHLNQDAQVYRADGKFTPGLTVLNMTPQLNVKEAQAALENDYKNWEVEGNRLVILPDFKPPVLTYEFSLKQQFTQQQIFVDANTGRIIKHLQGVTSN